MNQCTACLFLGAILLASYHGILNNYRGFCPLFFCLFYAYFLCLLTFCRCPCCALFVFLIMNKNINTRLLCRLTVFAVGLLFIGLLLVGCWLSRLLLCSGSAVVSVGRSVHAHPKRFLPQTAF